jgi:hypothetical protein
MANQKNNIIYVLNGGEEWNVGMPHMLKLTDEEYEMAKEDAPRKIDNYEQRCKELAGITKDQWSAILDLMPESLLPLVKKILEPEEEITRICSDSCECANKPENWNHCSKCDKMNCDLGDNSEEGWTYNDDTEVWCCPDCSEEEEEDDDAKSANSSTYGEGCRRICRMCKEECSCWIYNDDHEVVCEDCQEDDDEVDECYMCHDCDKMTTDGRWDDEEAEDRSWYCADCCKGHDDAVIKELEEDEEED